MGGGGVRQKIMVNIFLGPCKGQSVNGEHFSGTLWGTVSSR